MVDLERLRELAEKATPGEWQLGNNGAARRCWFVWRPKDARNPGGPIDTLNDKRGHLRRFGSWVTAERARAVLARGEG